MSTYLDKLQALPPEIVNDFLIKGDSSAISKEMQLFIMQIQWAAEITRSIKSISRAASKLRTRVLMEQRINLPIPTAKSRIYAAMEYLHVENNVAQAVWDMDTADKLQDYALALTRQRKFNEAAKWTDRANDLRKQANTATQKNGGNTFFLVSNKITHEELGFGKKNLKEIARKHKDGYYLNLINNDLKDHISKEERKQLLQDANISDAEYEEVEND